MLSSTLSAMTKVRTQNLLLGFCRQQMNVSQRRMFSLDTTSLPVVDATAFINGGTGDIKECEKLIDCLRKYGCLAIRDPRVDDSQNQSFLDSLETYFHNTSADYYGGKDVTDIKPQYGYQVGATPDKTETARNHALTVKDRFRNDVPDTPQPPPANGLWRFFWRVGEIKGEDSKLLPPQVIPKGYPEWETTMDSWGYLMRNSVYTVSEMIALGYGWERNMLKDRMEGACQLLAPTGSDLSKYNQHKDILAGFHYDLNFITVHGKSRYPGLSVWTRDGTKMEVKVPDGCVLIQAAKQLEWLTGGDIEAGFHEVVVSDKTLASIEKAKAAGKTNLWRVSSTMFSQMRFDSILEPLEQFSTKENREKYPPTLTYKQVEGELKEIGLIGEEYEQESTAL